MRTHFPGALHEVRSAARFPLSFAGAWIPMNGARRQSAAGDCANGKAEDEFCISSQSFWANTKEDELMEKELAKQEQNMSTESKCPVWAALTDTRPRRMRTGGRIS